jgi:arabinose-5-phosphate isomerase
MSLDYAAKILRAEIAAIESVLSRLDENFAAAVDLIANAPDCRVVTCGIGKAGIIAQKTAATLASTGTGAFYMHPSDALHGDLGMTRASDICLIFSNSGESDEISRLLPYLRRNGLGIVAITASRRSTLGVLADIVLEMGDLDEACPLGLAPTASTTAMLALGDALAMALMKRKGFGISEYAKYHPAGELGRKALTVAEVMRSRESVAMVGTEATVGETLGRITAARAGCAIVVDADHKLCGIFTDGDLRRELACDQSILAKPVKEVMTQTAFTIQSNSPAVKALAMLCEHRIGEMPVLDDGGTVVGMVDLKGLVAAGLA